MYLHIEFSVSATLYALQQRTAIMNRPDVPANDLPRHRILVVEDHHLNRRLAGLFLTKMNCQQEFCCNGLEALNLVQQEPFDLILMDVNMPVMDGLAATRAIRALQSTVSKIPIVIYSADVRRENRESSILAGASVFMPKPVDFQSFRSLLTSLLPREQS
jgi:CheY-like chemotaxis protein